jgi:2-keto-4-pentenoate hydratase/2-oxohepta-3-ene-1,7-dioic acid hydratase in catechol pathway
MALIARVRIDGRIEPAEVAGDVVRTASGREVPLAEALLDLPSAPSKVVCVGFNYRDHADELGWPYPEEPIFFIKPPSALVPHRAAVAKPAYCGQMDYEGELAVVIGRTCRDVPRATALDHVLGYACFNDLTARDVQKTEKQWYRAKAFDGSGPYGPVIATGIDGSDLAIRTRVNGELRQDSRTSQLIFDIPTLIAEASKVATLVPGDVIATGTPFGGGPVGPGDVIEVEIEAIGTLVTRIAG